ncbi:MAG: hypothetical protein JNM27_08725 [Leptospirales bacterium]|nr:hypothetical protein [Leptospirales bacterium]
MKRLYGHLFGWLTWQPPPQTVERRTDLSAEERREEALMYLGETISANRALKEWMLRNTYYAVVAQGAVYALFEKNKGRDIAYWLAGFLILAIWMVSSDILKRNRDSINNLRNRERSLIKEFFPVVETNWAGGNLENKIADNHFLWIYLGFIFLTGIVLLIAMRI